MFYKVKRIQEWRLVWNVNVKTILARMSELTEKGYTEEDNTKINDVAKALSAVGIALTDDEGKFRNFADVIDELGAKWQSLDERTKAYVATALAGTRQQSRLYTLMENYSEAIELYNGAMQSSGVTVQKYNRYLEGTEAHLNQLRATLEKVWVRTFDTGAIRFTIDLLTKLLNVYSELVRFAGLPLQLSIAGNLYAMLSSQEVRSRYVKSGEAVLQSIGSLSLKKNFTEVKNEMLKIVGLVKATNNESSKLQLMWQSMAFNVKQFSTNLLAGVLGFAKAVAPFVAISVALNLILNLINKISEKRAEIKQARETIIETYRKNATEIDKKLSEYFTLLSSNNLNIEQQQRLVDVQNELANIMPTLVAYYDELGDARLKDAKSIQEELQYTRDLVNLQAQKEKQGFITSISGLLSEKKRIENFELDVGFGAGVTGVDVGRRDREAALKLEQNIRHKEVLSELQKKIIDYVAAQSLAEGVYNKLTEKQKQYIEGLIREKATTLTTVNDVQNFADKMIKLSRNIAGATEKLNELRKEGKLTDEQIFNQLAGVYGFDAATQVMSNYHKTAISVADTIQHSIDIFNKYADEINELSGAYQELDESNVLSINTMMNLLKNYPQLISYMSVENGQLKLQKEAIIELMKLKEEEFKNTIKQEREKALAILNTLKAYGFQIETMIDVVNAQKMLFSARHELSPEEYANLNSAIQSALKAKELIDSYDKLLNIDFSKYLTTKKGNKKEYEGKLSPFAQYEYELERLNNLIDETEKKMNRATDKTQYYDQLNKYYSSLLDLLNKYNSALTQTNNNLVKQIESYKIGNKQVIDFDSATGRLIVRYDLYNRLSGEAKEKLDKLMDTYNDNLSKIYSNSQRILDIQEKIATDGFAKINNELEKFNNHIKFMDYNLNIISNIMNRIGLSSEQYAISLAMQRDILLQKRQLLQDEINYVEQILKKNNLNYEQQQQLREELLQLKASYIEVDKEIDNYVKTVFESYYNYMFDMIEEEINALEKAKDAMREAKEQQIALLEETIEKIEKENALLKEQEERQKKLKEIEQQKQKLQNVLNERNTRMLIDGKWVWVANPQTVREETDKLEQMIQDYVEWEADTQRQHDIDKLREQIDTINKEIKTEEQKYDERIKSLQDFLQTQKDLLDKQGKWQVTSLQQLMELLKGIESSKYGDRIKLLQGFVDGYINVQQQALDFIAEIEKQNYINRDLTLADFTTKSLEQILQYAGEYKNLIQESLGIIEQVENQSYIIREGLLTDFVNTANTINFDYNSTYQQYIKDLFTNLTDIESKGYIGRNLLLTDFIGENEATTVTFSEWAKNYTSDTLSSLYGIEQIAYGERYSLLTQYNQLKQQTIQDFGNLEFTKNKEIVDSIKQFEALSFEERLVYLKNFVDKSVLTYNEYLKNTEGFIAGLRGIYDSFLEYMRQMVEQFSRLMSQMYGSGKSNVKVGDIVNIMKQNSQRWWDIQNNSNLTSSQKKQIQEMLHQVNLNLGTAIGATYNSSTGVWTYPTNLNETVDYWTVQWLMNLNSQLWWAIDSAIMQNWLHDINQQLGSGIGATYTPSTGTWTYPTSSSSSKTSSTSLSNVVDLMKQNAQEWWNVQNSNLSSAEKKQLQEQLHAMNKALGASIGATYDSATGKWYKDGKPLFAQGGIVDYTGIAYVHGSKSAAEVVFNAEQAKKLYNIVKMLPSNLGFAGAGMSNMTNNYFNFYGDVKTNDARQFLNNLRRLVR